MNKASNKGRRRRVLVVEPDGDFCAMLCEFLRAQKFEIDSAHDAGACLQKIAEFKPDLVVLSRELPMANGSIGPDGLRALKVIKQDLKLRTPVIMFSGEASEADFDRYRKLKFSAEDYVRKPFEDTEILRRIENFVGFDISDDMDRIQENIDDAIDDPLARLFDADPEELGSSSSTRKEVARLLEQVGRELDRQDQELPEEESAPADLGGKATGPEHPDKEVVRLRQEIANLSRQLDLAQKQLVGERKRSREIKKEWKLRLTAIEAELKKSEEREARMRDEFEKMRLRFADIELEHTMELERVEDEKRRALEDLAAMQLINYPPDQMAEDLSRVARLLDEMMRKLEGK